MLEGEGGQEVCDNIGRLLLHQSFGPFIRSPQPEVAVDAVYRTLFETLYMCREGDFTMRLIEVTDDHAEDFLHCDLPCRRACLKFERIVSHGISCIGGLPGCVVKPAITPVLPAS